MSGQSNYLPACLKIFSYFKFLNLPIFLLFFFFHKDLITGSLKLKKVSQCLLYALRYRSLNSDKFVKQKLEPPPLPTSPSGNNSKFKYFLVKLPLLFIALCKGIRIPESRNFLLVESGILGFGIRNPALGIRNPTKDWNPESKLLKIHSRLD